jgi:hypothetical protein
LLLKDTDLPDDDAASLRTKAAHARRLAEGCTDRPVSERLRELAEKFEATAAALEQSLA